MAQGQHTDARPAFVGGQEGTSLDVLTMRLYCLGDPADGRVGQQILSSDLNDSRRGSTAGREDRREGQILRDHDELVRFGPTSASRRQARSRR
jgi:hypothetical protein